MEELWKRKSKDLERSGGAEEEIFKGSKITEGLPGKGIEKSERKEWMNEMKNGFEKMVERVERVMEEVRKEFKQQGRVLNEKMEEIWKEFKEQRREWREWREQREELKKNIEEMKKREDNLGKGKKEKNSLMQNGIGATR